MFRYTRHFPLWGRLKEMSIIWSTSLNKKNVKYFREERYKNFLRDVKTHAFFRIRITDQLRSDLHAGYTLSAAYIAAKVMHSVLHRPSLVPYFSTISSGRKPSRDLTSLEDPSDKLTAYEKKLVQKTVIQHRRTMKPRYWKDKVWVPPRRGWRGYFRKNPFIRYEFRVKKYSQVGYSSLRIKHHTYWDTQRYRKPRSELYTEWYTAKPFKRKRQAKTKVFRANRDVGGWQAPLKPVVNVLPEAVFLETFPRKDGMESLPTHPWGHNSPPLYSLEEVSREGLALDQVRLRRSKRVVRSYARDNVLPSLMDGFIYSGLGKRPSVARSYKFRSKLKTDFKAGSPTQPLQRMVKERRDPWSFTPSLKEPYFKQRKYTKGNLKRTNPYLPASLVPNTLNRSLQPTTLVSTSRKSLRKESFLKLVGSLNPAKVKELPVALPAPLPISLDKEVRASTKDVGFQPFFKSYRQPTNPVRYPNDRKVSGYSRKANRFQSRVLNTPWYSATIKRFGFNSEEWMASKEPEMSMVDFTPIKVKSLKAGRRANKHSDQKVGPVSSSATPLSLGYLSHRVTSSSPLELALWDDRSSSFLESSVLPYRKPTLDFDWKKDLIDIAFIHTGDSVMTRFRQMYSEQEERIDEYKVRQRIVEHLKGLAQTGYGHVRVWERMSRRPNYREQRFTIPYPLMNLYPVNYEVQMGLFWKDTYSVYSNLSLTPVYESPWNLPTIYQAKFVQQDLFVNEYTQLRVMHLKESRMDGIVRIINHEDLYGLVLEDQVDDVPKVGVLKSQRLAGIYESETLHHGSSVALNSKAILTSTKRRDSDPSYLEPNYGKQNPYLYSRTLDSFPGWSKRRNKFTLPLHWGFMEVGSITHILPLLDKHEMPVDEASSWVIKPMFDLPTENQHDVDFRGPDTPFTVNQVTGRPTRKSLPSIRKNKKGEWIAKAGFNDDHRKRLEVASSTLPSVQTSFHNSDPISILLGRKPRSPSFAYYDTSSEYRLARRRLKHRVRRHVMKWAKNKKHFAAMKHSVSMGAHLISEGPVWDSSKYADFYRTPWWHRLSNKRADGTSWSPWMSRMTQMVAAFSVPLVSPTLKPSVSRSLVRSRKKSLSRFIPGGVKVAQKQRKLPNSTSKYNTFHYAEDPRVHLFGRDSKVNAVEYFLRRFGEKKVKYQSPEYFQFLSNIRTNRPSLMDPTVIFKQMAHLAKAEVSDLDLSVLKRQFSSDRKVKFRVRRSPWEDKARKVRTDRKLGRSRWRNFRNPSYLSSLPSVSSLEMSGNRPGSENVDLIRFSKEVSPSIKGGSVVMTMEEYLPHLVLGMYSWRKSSQRFHRSSNGILAKLSERKKRERRRYRERLKSGAKPVANSNWVVKSIYGKDCYGSLVIPYDKVLGVRYVEPPKRVTAKVVKTKKVRKVRTSIDKSEKRKGVLIRRIVRENKRWRKDSLKALKASYRDMVKLLRANHKKGKFVSSTKPWLTPVVIDFYGSIHLKFYAGPSASASLVQWLMRWQALGELKLTFHKWLANSTKPSPVSVVNTVSLTEETWSPLMEVTSYPSLSLSFKDAHIPVDIQRCRSLTEENDTHLAVSKSISGFKNISEVKSKDIPKHRAIDVATAYRTPKSTEFTDIGDSFLSLVASLGGQREASLVAESSLPSSISADSSIRWYDESWYLRQPVLGTSLGAFQVKTKMTLFHAFRKGELHHMLSSTYGHKINWKINKKVFREFWETNRDSLVKSNRRLYYRYWDVTRRFPMDSFHDRYDWFYLSYLMSWGWWRANFLPTSTALRSAEEGLHSDGLRISRWLHDLSTPVPSGVSFGRSDRAISPSDTSPVDPNGFIKVLVQAYYEKEVLTPEQVQYIPFVRDFVGPEHPEGFKQYLLGSLRRNVPSREDVLRLAASIQSGSEPTPLEVRRMPLYILKAKAELDGVVHDRVVALFELFVSGTPAYRIAYV